MNIFTNDVKVCAISAVTPNKWESLSDRYAEQEGQTFVDKFAKKAGVIGRFRAGEKQTTADLCFAAAENLLSAQRINRDEIGAVVLVTQTGDYISPCGAEVLQYRLGLSRNCIAFDVNLGCSGFTNGLGIVGSMLSRSDCKYGLLLCGETPIRRRNPVMPIYSPDGHGEMLFGDAGTAALLEKTDAVPGLRVTAKTDGSEFRAIIRPYGLYRNPVNPGGLIDESKMDELKVFQFSTSEVPKMILDYMQEAGSKPEDYDCLALHQANKYIMDRIVKKTGFAPEQSLVSIDRFGNTSSASIPVSLVDRYGKSDGSKQLRVLACGYGVGLSWSCVEFRVNEADILPLTQTDEYFEDGF